MEQKQNPLFDADDIQYRLSCGITALFAVHAAMEYGPFEPKRFVDALFGIWAYLNTLNTALRDCIDRGFEPTDANSSGAGR